MNLKLYAIFACALMLSGCIGPTKKDHLKQQAKLEERLESLKPEESEKRYSTLVELADVRGLLDDYEGAKKAFQKAIDITNSSSQNETTLRRRAYLLHDLADLHFLSKNEQTALDYYNESLKLFREIEGPDSNSFEVCLGLLNIGNAHHALGNKSESEEVFAEFHRRNASYENDMENQR